MNTRATLPVRAPRTLDPVKGVRGELHDAIRSHRLIASETQHEVSQNFPDQAGTVVLIGVDFEALPDIGDFAVPMLFIPFHDQPDSQQEREDNAA